jgi:hypothetical protein
MRADVHAGRHAAGKRVVISARILANSDVSATNRTLCTVQWLAAGAAWIDEILRTFRNSFLSPIPRVYAVMSYLYLQSSPKLR